MNEIRHTSDSPPHHFKFYLRGHSAGGFGFGVELSQPLDQPTNVSLLPATSGKFVELTYLSGYDYFNPNEDPTLLFGIGGGVIERAGDDQVSQTRPPYLEYTGGSGLLLGATTPEAILMLNFLGSHCVAEDPIILRRLEDGTFDVTLVVCQSCGHGIRHPEAAVRAKKCSLCLYSEWKQQFVPEPEQPAEENKPPVHNWPEQEEQPLPGI